MVLSRLFENSMNLILPRVCAICDIRLSVPSSSHFCGSCSAGMRRLKQPCCRSCGTEVSGFEGYQALCGECLRDPPPYLFARSVMSYETQIQRLVHKLKYNSDLSVLPGISELICDYDISEFADIDYVVVVPLHPSRLRKRGLNQALVLSRLFFPDRPASIKPDWLIRRKNTVPQTELGRSARQKNLQDVFKISPRSNFHDAKVCLVDDVLTTGTTVKECSKVIMKSGADVVKVLTLARVLSSPAGTCVMSDKKK